MNIPAFGFKVISTKNGKALIEMMCWGCGEIFQTEIPMDDVGTEFMTAQMCVDCRITKCK